MKVRGERMAKLIFASVLIAALAACSSPLKNWDPNDYTVRSGDTIYSIAWRYEIDPDDLVRWNRLQSASLIYPGQRLRTRKPPGFDKRKPAVTAKADDQFVEIEAPAPPPRTVKPTKQRSITVKQDQTLYAIARQHGVSAGKLIAWNGLKKPYTIYPGQRLRLQPPATTSRSAKKTSPPPQPKRQRLTWQWPLKGKVIRSYNSKRLDSRGIDISGKTGLPVLAAAPGKVVYSGNGLISYGNLVIIKHNSTYLSAYANNASLLVKEGETVNQGQAIAKMGKTGSKNPYLHFEIRKNGKPVDPRRYLPRS